MQLKGKYIVLSGAQGGIGQPLLALLKSAGATVMGLGRRPEPGITVADLADTTCVNYLSEKLATQPVDILINLAGLMYFGHTPAQPSHHLAAMMAVNLSTPIQLTQAVLPGMIARGSGQIVNIGSVFGALAFPHFSVYSSTKAGLRSFSESLRREYMGKGIQVTYIAPRAVNTPFNHGAITELHKRTKTTHDSPESIAHTILSAVAHDIDHLNIGFPEALFTHINALAPSLIDKALVSKRDIANNILMEYKL